MQGTRRIIFVGTRQILPSGPGSTAIMRTPAFPELRQPQNIPSTLEQVTLRCILCSVGLGFSVLQAPYDQDHLLFGAALDSLPTAQQESMIP